MIEQITITVLVIGALGGIIGTLVQMIELGARLMEQEDDLLSWGEKQPPPEVQRDNDLSLVEANNADWMERALLVVEDLPADFRGIGEDINAIVRERVGEPKSPNAYGALIRNAKRRNLIQWTGEMAPMKGIKSNARQSFIYIKGLREAA